MSREAAAVAASVPALIGYHPDEHTVVAVCADSAGDVRATLAFDFGDGQTLEGYGVDLGRAAAAIDRAGVTDVTVIGHSIDGTRHANRIGRTIEAHTSGRITSLTVASMKGVTSMYANEKWTAPVATPDYSLDFIMQGVDVADSRAQLVNRFERDPIPSWSAPDAETRRTVERLHGDDRIAAAKMWLIELTGAGTSGEPAEYARLGHLLDTSQPARDVVTAFAARSTDGADVLHAAYLGAPDEYRDVLGAAAGISHLVAYRDTVGARAMLTEVSPASAHSNLARIGLSMMETTLTPTDVGNVLTRVASAYEAGQRVDRTEMEAVADLARRVLPTVAPRGAAQHYVEQRGPVAATPPARSSEAGIGL